MSRSIHWYTALLSHTRWSFLVVGSPAPPIRTLVNRGNRRTSGRIWVATSHRPYRQHAVAWIAEGAWMIFFCFVNNSQCLYFVKPWKLSICFGRSKCCGRAVNAAMVVSCSIHIPRQKREATELQSCCVRSPMGKDRKPSLLYYWASDLGAETQTASQNDVHRNRHNKTILAG